MTFISYAQNFEDVMLWRALRHVERGFYVDVGASDPITDSVTQAFYERGWHGVNIEPMHSSYERLCTERPRDINLPVAVAEAEGELIFYEILDSGLSTTNRDVAQKHRNAGLSVLERNVQALTLNQVLKEHADGPIHFLKVDVEGTEEEVMQGLDLKRWRPWVLTVEATIPNSSEENYSCWEPYILESGYEFVYFDALNRFYVAREQITLAQAFKTPPNYFDDFMTFREHSARRTLQAELKTLKKSLFYKIGRRLGLYK